MEDYCFWTCNLDLAATAVGDAITLGVMAYIPSFSITFLLILGLIVLAPLLSRIEKEYIDHIKLLLLSSLMLLLFLLGITILLRFIGLVHLSVKGGLIGLTLLLMNNISGPYQKKNLYRFL